MFKIKKDKTGDQPANLSSDILSNKTKQDCKAVSQNYKCIVRS